MADVVLQLLGITKIYNMGESKVHALRGITLEIEQGEMVSIMGPSGCGKSTMLQIAGCLDRPTEGRMRVIGLDVVSLNDQQLARVRNKHIGFIFQSFNLLPHENALNNVLVPIQYSGISRKQGEAAAKRALEAVGLGDRIHHKPNELSGGQRQRVAIARAIVNEPSVILADEPTGALDQNSGKEVMGILQRLNAQGKTIVLVTHDADVAKHARRIVELRDGRIVNDANIQPVSVSEEEIWRSFQENIASADQRICAKCNIGNRANARFCAYCGFTLDISKKMSDTIMRKIAGMEVDCPYCAFPNRPFAKYCINCGGALEDAMKVS